MDVRELLYGKTKKELLILTKKLDLTKYSRLNKAELVDKIVSIGSKQEIASVLSGEMFLPTMKGKGDGLCKYWSSISEQCGRPLYDKHCIFHSRDTKEKERQFVEKFSEELEIQKHKGGRFDFTGFVFPEKANLILSNLSGVALYGANLSRVNLWKANLSRTDLTEANLTGANLMDANLIGAKLGRAVFTKATLMDTNLSGADLTGADMRGSFLGRVNLSGANLTGTDMRGSFLGRANLSGVNRTGTDMRCSFLSRINLSGADLSATDLRGSFLGRVNLSRADLSGADLRGAILSKVNLRDAKIFYQNLQDVILSEEQRAEILIVGEEEIQKEVSQHQTEQTSLIIDGEWELTAVTKLFLTFEYLYNAFFLFVYYPETSVEDFLLKLENKNDDMFSIPNSNRLKLQYIKQGSIDFRIGNSLVEFLELFGITSEANRDLKKEQLKSVRLDNKLKEIEVENALLDLEKRKEEIIRRKRREFLEKVNNLRYRGKSQVASEGIASTPEKNLPTPETNNSPESSDKLSTIDDSDEIFKKLIDRYKLIDALSAKYGGNVFLKNPKTGEKYQLNSGDVAGNSYDREG